MRLPPFDWSRSRDEYPNDGSVSTTVRIVAFYRSVEITYNRPLRRQT